MSSPMRDSYHCTLQKETGVWKITAKDCTPASLQRSAGIDAFLRRTDMPEHREEREIVSNLQHPSDQQRPAESGQAEQIASDDRAHRRCEASGNRRQARRGGTF